MTNAGDPREAIRNLLTAATDLADRHGLTERAGESASVAGQAKADVTECVTIDQEYTAAEDKQEAATVDTPEQQQRNQLPQQVKRGEAVDLDTVRLERAADYKHTKRWIVLSGSGNGARLVGYVSNVGTGGKKWQSLRPDMIPVAGGGGRTRQDALLRLLESHVPNR